MNGYYEEFLKSLLELSEFVLKLPPSKAAIVVIVSGLVFMAMLIPSIAVKILSMDKLSIALMIGSGFGLICGTVSLLRHGWELLCERRKRKAESRVQEEARSKLKECLLSLPLKASYILRYLYVRPSHRAYIPCDNADAERLYRDGFIKSRRTTVKRGHGYSYECDCYDYEMSEEVLLYLSGHIEELGTEWGYDWQAPDFSRYQRAGKAVVLEHSHNLG
ncbi:MAG: hypothetical protein II832_02285 [Synergistaceae bacterium]|nr:hypothetical protein [Synergistaceae bacterium]